MALSPNYDALVTGTTDNVLIAITGQQGDGIAMTCSPRCTTLSMIRISLIGPRFLLQV